MSSSVEPDSVQLAFETGRLDFVSVLLACIAILFAISTVPIFFYLRMRAEKIARVAAEKALEGASALIEQRAIARMEEMLPSLVEAYTDLARSSLSPEAADEVAAAQESEPENGLS